MADLTHLTRAGALDGLAKGSFTSRELTDAHLAAMEQARGLNAFIVETPEKARAMADASDARRKAGQAGALEGIPLGIKDLFCTEGVQTTAGSHILEGFTPTYERSEEQTSELQSLMRNSYAVFCLKKKKKKKKNTRENSQQYTI